MYLHCKSSKELKLFILNVLENPQRYRKAAAHIDWKFPNSLPALQFLVLCRVDSMEPVHVRFRFSKSWQWRRKANSYVLSHVFLTLVENKEKETPDSYFAVLKAVMLCGMSFEKELYRIGLPASSHAMCQWTSVLEGGRVSELPVLSVGKMHASVVRSCLWHVQKMISPQGVKHTVKLKVPQENFRHL